MTKKQITNDILAANGGLHSERALATAHDIMLNHDLCQPILYHMVLTGSESIATYQAVVKALVRRLRNYGCRAEYFGAFENQPMKGLHAHCFLLIETSKKLPFKILDIKDGGYLSKLQARYKLAKPIHLAKPKNPMHGGQFFARPVGEEKLANCMAWATYEYKQRSKLRIPARETYFNSEFKANTVKRAAELAALVAPKAAPAPQAEPVAQEAAAVAEQPSNQPTINDIEGDVTMNDNSLTPAGHAYLSRLYEGFVDKRLNVAQIKTELAKAGIRRTVGQVEFDLTHRYGFTSYAERYPAPPVMTRAELDAIEKAKASKPARIVRRVQGSSTGYPAPYPVSDHLRA